MQSIDKHEAALGELPWQAIIFLSNYTFKCGASIIGEKYLLTINHCVLGYQPKDLKARVGEWQVNSFHEKWQYQDIDIARIISHPKYNPKSQANSIAILELVHPYQFDYHIRPICLSNNLDFLKPGDRCLVSGWGKDSFTGNFQHIIKKVDVPYVDHHTCQDLLRRTRLTKWFQLDKSFLCAGGEAGKDACTGDGGGPLICYNQYTDSYVQVGITAWGIGCGEQDVPGVYTDVSQFVPWILTYITQSTQPGVTPY